MYQSLLEKIIAKHNIEGELVEDLRNFYQLVLNSIQSNTIGLQTYLEDSIQLDMSDVGFLTTSPLKNYKLCSLSVTLLETATPHPQNDRYARVEQPAFADEIKK